MSDNPNKKIRGWVPTTYQIGHKLVYRRMCRISSENYDRTCEICSSSGWWDARLGAYWLDNLHIEIFNTRQWWRISDPEKIFKFVDLNEKCGVDIANTIYTMSESGIDFSNCRG